MNRKHIGIIAVILAILLITGIKSYINREVAEQVDQAITEAQSIAGIEYKDLEVKLLSRDLTLEDVSITNKVSGERYDIEQMTVYDFDNKNDIPQFINMAWKGVEVQGSGKNIPGTIKELGYNSFPKGNYTLSYKSNPEKKELRIDNFSVALPKMGNAQLQLNLADIVLDKNSLVQLIFGYDQIKILDGKFKYTDDSLISRLMEFSAKSKQEDLATFKQTLISQMYAMAGTYANDPEVKDILKQLEKFINTPGNLEISVQPDNGVSLQDIIRTRTPADTIKLLNMKINV